MRLSFTVHGDPKPQGSKRAFVTKYGRAVLVESAGAPLKDWRADVTTAAVAALHGSGWHHTDEPVGVSLAFTMRSPKRPKYDTPATRPDLDKMARSVLDSITAAGVWGDDSQVVDLILSKRYGTQPGVEVTVWLA